MELQTKWKQFTLDPFGFVNQLEPSFKDHVFNPFLKFRLNRRLAFFFAMVLGLVPWVLFGFDSCITQPLMLLHKLPALLLGKTSFKVWIGNWSQYYGTAMHYSAFLTYGLMYWFLSRYFDKRLGIVKSKNVAYSAGLTFLSIGIFELYWQACFAVFQNQAWVFAFKMPQLRIILQNLIFGFVGGLAVLYMYVDSFSLWKPPNVANLKQHWRIKRLYTFRVDKTALALVAVTVGFSLLWIYYPGYVKKFSVPLENGEVWTSSQRFPQTLYTIDVNPTDSVNAGVWFFVENDWVHGINVFVKALMALTVCYVGLVKEVKQGEEKI